MKAQKSNWSRRRIGLWLLLLVLLILALWVPQNMVFEQKTVYTGLRGEAAWNPLLALQKWLEFRQHPVLSKPLYDSLESSRSQHIILPFGATNLNLQQATALLQQVQEGSSLLLSSDSPMATQSAALWQLLGWRIDKLEDVDWEKARQFLPMKIDYLGQDFVLQFKPDQILMPLPDAPQLGEISFQIEAAYGTHLLLIRYGLGRIILSSDADWISNSDIDEDDHAAWFLTLLQAAAGERFLLVFSGEQTSLLASIWQNFSLAVILLGVTGGLFIWSRVPRFVPQYQQFLPPRRDFSEHLRQAGRLEWRLYRQPPGWPKAATSSPRRKVAWLVLARKLQQRHRASRSSQEP